MIAPKSIVILGHEEEVEGSNTSNNDVPCMLFTSCILYIT